MKPNPMVTVATLCYNNSENVIKTLHGISKQTYSTIDHVIIDDCSKDDSFEMIKDWILANNYKCRIFKNEKNLGICKSLNKIVGLAEGEYLAINCDDYWEPFHIEKSLEILYKTGADVIYSSTKMCRANGDLLCNVEDTLLMANYERFDELFNSNQNYFLLKNEIALDALFYLNYLHPISLIIPTTSLKLLGGFNEALPFEDYDMNFKICSKLKVCFNKSFQTIYYKHEKSYTENPKLKVKLFSGIILTLMTYKHLISFPDTKQKVEATITEYCLQIIAINSRSFIKMMKIYGEAFPEKKIQWTFLLFTKAWLRNSIKMIFDRRKLSYLYKASN